MATTNNVQGDEPRPIILKRQVQTLTVAVERLTKQNHDLEEQLHQRNVGHNTQEEDQGGTNADRRYQKRLDMSPSSTADIVPPHVVVELQMMRERMDLMMNALRG